MPQCNKQRWKATQQQDQSKNLTKNPFHYPVNPLILMPRDGISELSDGSFSDVESCTELGVRPYMFEPIDSNPNSEAESGGEENSDRSQQRMDNTEWCSCGCCQVMPTARECVCCSEMHKVEDKKEEQRVKCITDHPGFAPLCLNPYVLEVAYLQYRQQYGDRDEQHNERYRYTAYRQFVRWIFKYLGREVRVIIPACAVRAIRSAFPDPDQEYTGFHQADSDGSD